MKACGNRPLCIRRTQRDSAINPINPAIAPKTCGQLTRRQHQRQRPPTMEAVR
jgi:hypothetical protein